MADQVIADAVVAPTDEGLPNLVNGEEDWGSAGLQMSLALAADGGSYARSSSELTFTGHDAANDEVDVSAGVAYLDLSGETIDVQSGKGGTSPPAYDTTLPTNPSICVIVPTVVSNLSVQDSTLSSVWLAYATDGVVGGVNAGDVYIRSDDTGSVTAPPHPSVKLGESNPDNASADTILNRIPKPSEYGFVEPGMILIWSGAITEIPSGWVLCDGNNGTPNLQDKFVVGAGNTYAVDATGGESMHQLTNSEMPSHSHSFSAVQDGEWEPDGPNNDNTRGSVSSNTGGAGSDSAHENKPPYHALAYIMKV